MGSVNINVKEDVNLIVRARLPARFPEYAKMSKKSVKNALKEAREFIKNKDFKQAIEKCQVINLGISRKF